MTSKILLPRNCDRWWRGYRDPAGYGWVVREARNHPVRVLWHASQPGDGWGIASSDASRAAMWDAILRDLGLPAVNIDTNWVIEIWQHMPAEGWIMTERNALELLAVKQRDVRGVPRELRSMGRE